MVVRRNCSFLYINVIYYMYLVYLIVPTKGYSYVSSDKYFMFNKHYV